MRGPHETRPPAETLSTARRAGARRRAAGRLEPADSRAGAALPLRHFATAWLMKRRPSSRPGTRCDGRRRLFRQVDDGLGERLGREPGWDRASARVPRPVAACARSELLGARRHARHDQAPLLERQHLAERVVAAEAHDAGGLLDEVLEMLVELERGHARQAAPRARSNAGPLPRRQERPVHDERRPREPAVEALVGRRGSRPTSRAPSPPPPGVTRRNGPCWTMACTSAGRVPPRG